ncbi:MAG: hypothetical protein K2Q10_12185 [Rhodospirillales bacterium]|nr:hypothetical protein [Rhodospirillales bacterium]
MFDFPATIGDIAAVPETFRNLYVAKEDGSHTLAPDLAAKLASGEGAAKDRQAAHSAAEQLKAWQVLGTTPDEIARLLAAQDAADQRNAEAKGEWDKLKNQLLTRHQAELAARDAELTRLSEALRQHLITACASQAIAAAKGVPELLLPLIEKSARVVLDEDDYFVVRVVDAQETPRLNSDGSFMNVADLVAELRRSEVYGRAFDGTGISGSGSPANAAQSGAQRFTLTREQARDPATYRRVRDEALKVGMLPVIVD